jgi:penicillin-binding protein 1A
LLARRQPGSVFKPFVFAAALEKGYTPATEVMDEPIRVPQGKTVWTPKNHGGEYGGRITFRRALIRSANSATIRVSQMVGMPAVLERAHRNGIVSELPNVPAAALGAVEVTPLELVTAYAPFANGGWRVKPRLVRRLEAPDGTVLWANDNVREQTMDPRDAYQMTSMLRGVVDYGTGYLVREYGVRGLMAGKTGTTNDGADVWFLGYTPTLVAGFWFGYDDPRPVSYDASGGRLATPAWVEFYRTGWTEPPTDKAWQPPNGMTVATIDARTGWLANTYCPITKQDYFKPGTEPKVRCPYHAEPPQDSLNLLQQIPGVVEQGVKGLGNFLKKVFKGGGDSSSAQPRDTVPAP